MKTVLFLGTRIGFEAICSLLELNTRITHVFVDREHAHEIQHYDSKIIGLCNKHEIHYHENVKSKEIKDILKNEHIDYIFCFGFRRLIPPEILAKAKYAALSTHFSLLPEYRGFAPVNWAIINGESKCGVSLFHMESDADSGDIVAQRTVEIGKHDYANDVMDRCIVELKEILNETWEGFSKGKVTRIPQDHSKATFTCARNPEDGEINWSDSTTTIYNLIRGVSKPFPGAFTYLKGQKLTIWTAEPFEVGNYVGRIPGKVIQLHRGKGVVVLTGDGALLIKNVLLDLEGAHPHAETTADEYIKSVRLTLGK